jgi:hypothetical protein
MKKNRSQKLRIHKLTLQQLQPGHATQLGGGNNTAQRACVTRIGSFVCCPQNAG